MLAAQINTYGPADVIEVKEIARPAVQAGQVLVEVYAASLNPFDSALRQGNYRDAIALNLPITLGGDIAGVVAEIAGDVTDLSVGDRVYGQAAAVAGNSGALAEYAATAASQLAPAPTNLAWEEIAALPLVGVSALQALHDHIELKAGQKIFIHGGGGGIGSIALQIAKHIDAVVATTAAGDDLAYVKQLGADEVIDYKKQEFSQVLAGYDAAFDTVGGADFNKCLTILRQGGVAVTMIAEHDDALAEKLSLKVIRQSTKVNSAKLVDLGQLVEDGVVSTQLGQVFPLAQVKQAFITREVGLVRGKIVIKTKF